MMPVTLREAVQLAFVAFLLWLQSLFQERRRKIETERARDEQAEANAHKVVTRLVELSNDPTSGRTRIVSPLPPVSQRTTPQETPAAKADDESEAP